MLLIDTCSSQHVTGNQDVLYDVHDIPQERAFGFGITEITRAGAACINVATANGTIHNVKLPLVKYAPSLGNVFVLSVHRLHTQGYSIDADATSPCLFTPDKQTVPLMWRNNLLAANIAELTMLGSGDRAATDEPHIWHGRFAHLSHGTLCKIAQHCTGIPRLPHQPHEPCTACVKAKMQQRAISRSPITPPHVAVRAMEILAIDLCGPLPTAHNKAKYNFVVVDLFSRYKWCVPIRRKKSESIARAFSEFLAHANHVRDIRSMPRLVVSDGAPELVGQESAFATVLRQMHIDQSHSPRASSRLNSTVERAHGTIMTAARATMHHGNAPVSWWHWAATYSSVVVNFIPASEGRPSAYELFTGRKPDASRLRTLFCRAYVLDHDRASKLAERATPGVLVGLGPERGTYKVRLDRNGEVIESRSLYLLEFEFPLFDRHLSPEARAQLNLLTPTVPDDDDTLNVSSNDDVSSDDDMPPLVPITNAGPASASSDMPPLVPIANTRPASGPSDSPSSPSSDSDSSSSPSSMSDGTARRLAARQRRNRRPPSSSDSDDEVQTAPSTHAAGRRTNRTRQQRQLYDPDAEAARPQWGGSGTYFGYFSAANTAQSDAPLPSRRPGGASRGGAVHRGASHGGVDTTADLSRLFLPISNAVFQILVAVTTICLTTLHFFLTSCAKVAQHGFSRFAAPLPGGVEVERCTCHTTQRYDKPSRVTSRNKDKPAFIKSKPAFYGATFYGASINSESDTDIKTDDVYSRPEPATAKIALSGRDAGPWGEALAAEWDMLWSRGTFKWVPISEVRLSDARARAITATWVLKAKVAQRKLKARLVARGCQQTSWPETFAPTAAATHMRLLIGMCIIAGQHVYCIDWRSAYLYADLPPGTVIYMRPPFPYERPGYWLQLVKSLYGLKQAGNLYYRLARDTNRRFGLGQSLYDPAFSFGPDMLASSHVDDVMIGGAPEKLLKYVSFLQKQGYDVAVENPIKQYLGVEYKVDDAYTKYELRQSAAILKIVKEHGVEHLPPRRTPAPLEPDISELGVRAPEDPEPDLPYRAAVGSLMYLAVNTRPDIMFVTCSLARYLTNFTADHYERAQHVIRYLKGTVDLPFVISKERLGDSELSAWVDADWATCKTTRRSVSGYVVCMGDVPVSWASSRQIGVAGSSCEAEYVAISDCVRRVCELRNFLTSIGRKPTGPTVVRTDSQSAIHALHGPVIAQRLRHIDIRMHRTRQAIDDGDIKIVKVPTQLNRADGLTKVLPRASFEEFFHRQLMGGSTTSPTSPAAPPTPRGASQDDVGVDSISVEEQVAGSAVREQSSQCTPRSGRKPT
jgi:hypothetical protein